MHRRTKLLDAQGTRRPKPFRMLVSLMCLCLILSGTSMATASIRSWAEDCDLVPTGVERSDYWLHFTVPPGLMPDKQFDNRPAKLHVRRVQPVYASKKCPEVLNKAAVLIHGRAVPGPVAFDLQHPAPGGGTLSVQEALASAGIDTFAPSLLGYGHSTTFTDGLDDPANASLPGFAPDGTCGTPEGCDRTHNPNFEFDQQGKLLLRNPLDGQRRSHSSNVRFARIDVWVRDIGQVIDDAIAQAQPAGGKVTLVGHSLGAVRAGRSLNMVKFPDIAAKVEKAVFLSPFFFVAPNVQAPSEETTPPTGFVTFPMALSDRTTATATAMPNEQREAACAGYEVDGSNDQMWAQLMAHDDLGRDWGGPDKNNPAGLLRTPTFSTYGWNTGVAGQLTPPTLVMQGVDDTGLPAGAANAPAVTTRCR